MSDTANDTSPDDLVDDIVDLPGVFLEGLVRVLCGRCAELGRTKVLSVRVKNSNPEDPGNIDEYTAECDVCTGELGKVAAVPILLVAGTQAVSQFLEEEESEEGVEGAVAP